MVKHMLTPLPTNYPDDPTYYYLAVYLVKKYPFDWFLNNKIFTVEQETKAVIKLLIEIHRFEINSV